MSWQPPDFRKDGYQCLLAVMVEQWHTDDAGRRVNEKPWGPVWVHAEWCTGDPEVGIGEGWNEYGSDPIEHDRIVGYAPLPETP